MNMVAERRHSIDGLDNVAGKVPRVRSGKAHAADSANQPNRGEQLSEGHLAGGVSIGIYILAEKLNLGEACVGHSARFGEDGNRGA